MKGDLCGKILSRGIEQQNAVGLEKISVDRDAAPLIHPLSLILSPCPYAIGRRNSSRTGYPSCGQVHDARLRAFLVDDYHHRPHGETRLPPQARWEAGGFLPRLPETLEQLDLLLLTVARARRVHRDGIHFAGLRYIDLTLAAYVGEAITVRYDPRDMAEIRVYHEDRFLCHAVCQELAGQTVELKDVLKARDASGFGTQSGYGARRPAVAPA